MTVVLDALAIGSVLLPDEDEQLARLVREVCRSEQLHVPAVWRSKVASLLRKAHKRKRIDDEQLQLAAAAADIVAVGVLVGPDLPVQEIVAGSAAHNLSAYDYTYSALAHALGVPLLTGDGQLRNAAVTAGLSVRRP